MLATKLKALEEKAKMYEKHIKATADKASALEKDAAESKKKVKVNPPTIVALYPHDYSGPAQP